MELWPSPLVRTGTDYQVAANWIGKVIQGLIQKQIYVHVNTFKLSFGRFFAWPVETLKSGQMTI